MSKILFSDYRRSDVNFTGLTKMWTGKWAERQPHNEGDGESTSAIKFELSIGRLGLIMSCLLNVRFVFVCEAI